MQTRAVTLKFYRQLRRLLPFHALDDKLFGVVFAAINAPLILLTGFVLAARDASLVTAVVLLLVATLLCCGLALWALHHLLAPVRMARHALQVYAAEQRVLPLPTDLGDDMGELLRDVRRTLERVEEGRARLESLADDDVLTGLPTRRNAQRYLELAAVAAERSGSRLSIGLLALNGMEALADRGGSVAADRALRLAAEFLKIWLKRRSDWVARWNGAEFIVIMFAGQPGATEYLDNLRREFARQMRGAEAGSLTLALGIVEQRRHEPLAPCLQRAAEALVLAQRDDAGRIVSLPPSNLRSVRVALAQPL